MVQVVQFSSGDANIGGFLGPGQAISIAVHLHSQRTNSHVHSKPINSKTTSNG